MERDEAPHIPRLPIVARQSHNDGAVKSLLHLLSGTAGGVGSMASAGGFGSPAQVDVDRDRLAWESWRRIVASGQSGGVLAARHVFQSLDPDLQQRVNAIKHLEVQRLQQNPAESDATGFGAPAGGFGVSAGGAFGQPAATPVFGGVIAFGAQQTVAPAFGAAPQQTGGFGSAGGFDTMASQLPTTKDSSQPSDSLISDTTVSASGSPATIASAACSPTATSAGGQDRSPPNSGDKVSVLRAPMPVPLPTGEQLTERINVVIFQCGLKVQAGQKTDSAGLHRNMLELLDPMYDVLAQKRVVVPAHKDHILSQIKKNKVSLGSTLWNKFGTMKRTMLNEVLHVVLRRVPRSVVIHHSLHIALHLVLRPLCPII